MNTTVTEIKVFRAKLNLAKKNHQNAKDLQVMFAMINRKAFMADDTDTVNFMQSKIGDALIAEWDAQVAVDDAQADLDRALSLPVKAGFDAFSEAVV